MKALVLATLATAVLQRECGYIDVKDCADFCGLRPIKSLTYENEKGRCECEEHPIVPYAAPCPVEKP